MAEIPEMQGLIYESMSSSFMYFVFDIKNVFSKIRVMVADFVQYVL